MTTLEYMKRQVVKHKRILDMVSTRAGITEEELNNIRSKIEHYETAVRALEKKTD